MVFNHKVHSELLRDNIKLEIVFKNSPMYSGDHFQLLLRLRHLGNSTEYESLSQSLADLDAKLNSLKAEYPSYLQNVSTGRKIENINKLNRRKSIMFFVKRDDDISASGKKFDNSMVQKSWNDLVAKRLRVIETLKYHQPITLMGSDLYMTGIFKYSKLAIDSMKLEKSSKLPSLFYSQDYKPTEEGELSETEIIPFFLIPQSLLFTEKSLSAGSTISFKIKSSTILPKDLPSSYISMSNNFSIAYHLCLDLFSINEFDKTPQHFPLKVPLLIHPFFDDEGRQNVCKLDGEIQIDEPFIIKELLHDEESQDDLVSFDTNATDISLITKSASALAIDTSSMKGDNYCTGDNAPGTRALKSKFKELATLLNPNDYEEDELIKEILNLQGPFFTNVHSSVPYQKNSSIEKNRSAKLQSENLSKVVSYLNSLEDVIYKKEYMINRNTEPVVKVTLNKQVYLTNDDIHLSLEFADSEKFKITSVLSILESHEVVNPKYSILEGEDFKGPHTSGFSVYENHSVLFDETKTLAMKFVPYSSNNFNIVPSIFKNNIFQHKYLIKIKLVLVDKKEKFLQDSSTNDKYGKHFKAVSTLEGEVLQFFIPVLMLPA